MASVRFTIPGEPRPKKRARSRIVKTRDGRMFTNHYTPAETRKEEEATRFIAARAMDGRAPFEGPVCIRAAFYRSVPNSWSRKKRSMALENKLLPVSSPDLDNFVKLSSDGCKGILWRDDSQVVEMHVYKRFSDHPRVVIEVSEIGGEDAKQA